MIGAAGDVVPTFLRQALQGRPISRDCLALTLEAMGAERLVGVRIA